MAAQFYNEGLFRFLSTAVSGSTDLRCLVLAGASLPAGTKDKDLDTVADVLAVSGATEAAASGYSRQDLASFTITKDDASDEVDITAAAPTMTNVAAGETWRMVVYYIEGASDAARQLVAYDEPASTLAPNGGDVTLPPFVTSVTSP